MKRTTISLPDDLHASLLYEARRRGVSLSELVREAAGEYATRVQEERPEPSYFNLGEGPDDGLGDGRDEALLADHLNSEHESILGSFEEDQRARG